MRCFSIRSWSAVTCLLAVSASSALAQSAEPKVRSATFYTLKSGSRADFLAAIKDWSEMSKKGGSERYYSLWASLSGPNEVVLVSNHQLWAELDAGPEAKLKEMAGQRATLTARIGNFIQSTRRQLVSLETDLSLPLANVEPPSMVRVIRTWVRPEHYEAYRALIKSDLLPAARKSGLKLYSIGRVRYGGSSYEFQSVATVANWAEMDGTSPIITGLGGQEAYQKYLNKQRPMVSRQEYEMYRLLKDQSYLPTPK